jgi:DNA-binding GntR family transcriptional regulator
MQILESNMPRGRNTELKTQLEREIVSGALRPGQRLDELSLATRFEVSRTPVREALLQLASIGLVEMRPRRGAIVASIGLKDLLDMFEVMAELEGMCARLAARRISDQECADLRAIFEESKAAVHEQDYDAYYACNVKFHETLYLASRNIFLADQTMALRNRLAPYRRSQLHQHGRLPGSLAEHESILIAIENRDVGKVENLMKQHLSAQGGSVQDFIATLPADVLNQTASRMTG